MKVDELDGRIIRMLQANGRLRNTEIGAVLDLSEGAIRKRIDRLIAGGVIRIVAVADPLKSGYSVIAIISMRATPSHYDHIATELAAMTEFRFIGQTIGSVDFVAEAWFKSTGDLVAFVSERLARLEGITQIDTVTINRMIRYAYDWGVESVLGPVSVAARE